MRLLRILLSVALGLIIFFAVLSYLASTSLRSHFLSEDFYTENLAENDAYNRLYDTVLVPRTQEHLKEEGRANFVGGLRVEEEEVSDLVKGVLPPRELRRQVEISIKGAVDYLNEEEDPVTGKPRQAPEAYVYFRPILGTRVPAPPEVEPVEGTAKSFLRQFLVDQLKKDVAFLPPPQGTLNQRITVLSNQLALTLAGLRDPLFPLVLPSLAGVPIEARGQVYDDAKALLIAGGLPPRITHALEEADAEIRDKLLLPDPAEAMVETVAVAMWPLVEPLIDQGFDEFRDTQLDSEDRFDPVARIARNRGEPKEEVLRDLDSLRGWLSLGKAFDSWMGILIIAAASLALGLLHLPNRRSVLGWPGLALLLSGGAFLAASIALRAQLPDRLETFLEVGEGGCNALAGHASSITPSLCELGVDVTRSMAEDVAGDLLVPSLIILIVGGGLVIAALFIRKQEAV